MAWEGINAGIRGVGLVSGDIALSAAQFRFVQMGTAVNGGVVLAATAGQRKILGVLQDKAPVVGDPVLVCGGGVTKMEAGIAITKGLPVMSDATGRAITCAVSASNHVQGYALEAAAAAGSIFTVFLKYDGPVSNDL